MLSGELPNTNFIAFALHRSGLDEPTIYRTRGEQLSRITSPMTDNKDGHVKYIIY